MAPSKQARHAQETNFSSGPDEKLIVERIYNAVMEQRLAPNTKLSESRLCEIFGVGRMRVRRALLLLSSQGIVELKANRGAFVACPDQGEANDVFEARLLIEPPLVRQLALSHSDDLLELLSAHIAREDAARTGDARTEMIRLSGEFHVRLAEATGNRVLVRILRELVTRTSLIVGLFGTVGQSSCPDDEHMDILKAIRERDPERAEQQMKSHLEHIRSGLAMDERKGRPDDLINVLGRD